ncbi:MAG: DUF1232 domain-containing protein [Alphaproteobacteria bacterium]|nr:DUF1232 domain-containing protein [Alphaproteobacteria bacterium]
MQVWIEENAALPAVIERHERIVREGLWRKLRRLAGRLPFAEDLVAAYYCAIDPATPLAVRATLIAAVAYFVVPIDAIPDVLALVGFSDDGAVLATAIAVAGANIMPRHRERARAALLMRPRAG